MKKLIKIIKGTFRETLIIAGFCAVIPFVVVPILKYWFLIWKMFF